VRTRWLKSGDRVGIVAPAGPVKAEQIQSALQLLEQNGLHPVLAPHLFDHFGIVSSTVENRLADLHAFYADEQIAAIWAARGGYGTIQLLERLDYALIQKAGKPIIGFSDITALQWAVWVQTGIPAFSGLALTLQATPENPYLVAGLEILLGTRWEITDVSGIDIVREGTANGILLSGTLALIASLAGTPFIPANQPIILCIEDVDEPIYRIDRMLHQLKLSGFLKQVRALLLGQFLWKNRALNIVQMVKEMFPEDVPIVANLPYGHITQSLLMPIGMPASIQTSPFRIQWDTNVTNLV